MKNIFNEKKVWEIILGRIYIASGKKIFFWKIIRERNIISWKNIYPWKIIIFSFNRFIIKLRLVNKIYGRWNIEKRINWGGAKCYPQVRSGVKNVTTMLIFSPDGFRDVQNFLPILLVLAKFRPKLWKSSKIFSQYQNFLLMASGKM